MCWNVSGVVGDLCALGMAVWCGGWVVCAWVSAVSRCVCEYLWPSGCLQGMGGIFCLKETGCLGHLWPCDG